MESPGTAPGSEPCITGAFIAIDRVAPNNTNIGGARGGRKWAKKNAPEDFQNKTFGRVCDRLEKSEA